MELLGIQRDDNRSFHIFALEYHQIVPIQTCSLSSQKAGKSSSHIIQDYLPAHILNNQ